MKTKLILAALILPILAGISCRGLQPVRTTLAFSLFASDVTPPVGHPLCSGWIKPVEAVDDPQYAKGVILSDGEARYVLCAVDWCRLENGAYEMFREKLAKAVGTDPSRVAVQTVHQHDALSASLEAQQFLDKAEDAPLHLDVEFLERTTDRLAAQAAASLKEMRPLTGVGFGSAGVEGFASSRRIPKPDGTWVWRGSKCGDPKLRAAPEGLIDPRLRTVTLFSCAEPAVRLHYYATHPMSYYGDGRVTADCPGYARERLEKEEGIPQIYFTGCGGDVAAGKYNDGSPEARERLTDRLYDGMKRSVASTEVFPASGLEWRVRGVRFRPRAEPRFQADHLRSLVNDPKKGNKDRLRAAKTLAWVERLKTRPVVDCSCVKIGPVTILNLPGETFVEFQLYAHQLCGDGYLAVAAYGECGLGYVCTADSFGVGLYEPGVSMTGPESEALLKAAIHELLQPWEESTKSDK